jgi:2-polyprenyl-3-methyl-5-hydroxy-6-metoxy-1,4-benzoquinol methylase
VAGSAHAWWRSGRRNIAVASDRLGREIQPETDTETDTEKIAELAAIIHAVRDRVRSRYPEPVNGTPPGDRHSAIRIAVADLLPLVHARDAAQAKIAAIGSVNPRAGGVVNKLIQFVKKTVARALQWFVRDQVTFNRETISALEATMDALNDHNRILLSLAAQTNEQLASVRAELAERVLNNALEVRLSEVRSFVEPVVRQVDLLKAETLELKDIRKHWIEWRADWEKKVAGNEIQFLRNAADMQGAFQHRVGLMESGFRERLQSQHTEYLGALDRANLDIQKRLWADLEIIRGEYEKLIHNELRVIRQRAFLSAPAAAQTVPAAARGTYAPDFDYGRFAERFRGSEDHVRRNLQFYKPYFDGLSNVLDIGCGRGEFLETMRELNVPARGIDLGAESVAQCRHKGLTAEEADLFEYLALQPDGEFDGIISSQVVEHLAPERVPELIRLCGAKLRRNGVLAIETPNPACLAIFATHFYLDPTHTRPVPHQLLAFYMEEAGFGRIEVHPLSPALESLPEIGELPENFRNRFFGGLDFAIIGRRL